MTTGREVFIKLVTDHFSTDGFSSDETKEVCDEETEVSGIDDNIRLAKQYYAQKNWEKAIDHFKTAIACFRKPVKEQQTTIFLNCYLFLVTSYFITKKYSDCFKIRHDLILSEAAAITDSEHVAIYYLMGRLFTLSDIASQSIQEMDFDHKMNTMKDLIQSIKIFPDLFEKHPSKHLLFKETILLFINQFPGSYDINLIQKMLTDYSLAQNKKSVQPINFDEKINNLSIYNATNLDNKKRFETFNQKIDIIKLQLSIPDNKSFAAITLAEKTFSDAKQLLEQIKKSNTENELLSVKILKKHPDSIEHKTIVGLAKFKEKCKLSEDILLKLKSELDTLTENVNSKKNKIHQLETDILSHFKKMEDELKKYEAEHRSAQKTLDTAKGRKPAAKKVLFETVSFTKSKKHFENLNTLLKDTNSFISQLTGYQADLIEMPSTTVLHSERLGKITIQITRVTEDLQKIEHQIQQENAKLSGKKKKSLKPKSPLEELDNLFNNSKKQPSLKSQLPAITFILKNHSHPDFKAEHIVKFVCSLTNLKLKWSDFNKNQLIPDFNQCLITHLSRFNIDAFCQIVRALKTLGFNNKKLSDSLRQSISSQFETLLPSCSNKFFFDCIAELQAIKCFTDEKIKQLLIDYVKKMAGTELNASDAIQILERLKNHELTIDDYTPESIHYLFSIADRELESESASLLKTLHTHFKVPLPLPKKLESKTVKKARRPKVAVPVSIETGVPETPPLVISTKPTIDETPSSTESLVVDKPTPIMKAEPTFFKPISEKKLQRSPFERFAHEGSVPVYALTLEFYFKTPIYQWISENLKTGVNPRLFDEPAHVTLLNLESNLYKKDQDAMDAFNRDVQIIIGRARLKPLEIEKLTLFRTRKSLMAIQFKFHPELAALRSELLELAQLHGMLFKKKIFEFNPHVLLGISSISDSALENLNHSFLQIATEREIPCQNLSISKRQGNHIEAPLQRIASFDVNHTPMAIPLYSSTHSMWHIIPIVVVEPLIPKTFPLYR